MLSMAPNTCHPFLNLCPLPSDFLVLVKRWTLSLLPLSLGWCCNLLWPIKHSRSNRMPVPSLGLRRPDVFPLALLLFLSRGHENMPGWTCSTLRYGNRAELSHHPSQSETKHTTPNVLCKLCQHQLSLAHVDWTMQTCEPPRCSLFYATKVWGRVLRSITVTINNKYKGFHCNHGKWD